jgi:hypothetical protein
LYELEWNFCSFDEAELDEEVEIILDDEVVDDELCIVITIT